MGHIIIQSPTTIIATANPTQSTWNDSQKVSLNITKEKIDTIKKTISHPTCSPTQKKGIIRKIMGVSPCCLCAAIPSVELSYEVGTKEYPARVVEYYCDSCIKIVFSREKLEPNNKDEIPAYYDCVKV